MTERAGFRLILEQRSGHLNDHARTSCHESMIIVTCTDDRASRAPEDGARGPGGPVSSRLALVNLAQSSGQPTLTIALIARRHWFRRLRLPETARPVAREPCAAAPGVRRASVRRTRAKLM